LTQIRHLEEAIDRVTAEITRRLTPAEETAPSGKEEEVLAERVPDSAAQPEAASAGRPPLSWLQAVILLCSIPGIGVSTAMGIVAEIGLTMQQFPSAGHLASWAGRCPGHRERAGKRAVFENASRQSLVTMLVRSSRSFGLASEEVVSG
jgi:transposase